MQHHVSTCFEPQMRDMASIVGNKAGKWTCVKEAACTLSGTAFPLAIVMGVAAMGTSPCAEMKIEVAPVCGMVGLSRSNLTTVADVDGHLGAVRIPHQEAAVGVDDADGVGALDVEARGGSSGERHVAPRLVESFVGPRRKTKSVLQFFLLRVLYNISSTEVRYPIHCAILE